MKPLAKFGRIRRLLPILAIVSVSACDDDPAQVITPPGDPTPERLEIVGGQNLVGVVGSRSSEPIAVRVVSRDGIPIEGSRVVFAIAEGQASVEEEVVETDASGVAFTFVQFGNSAGLVKATATAHGLTGSPATFDLMAIAADASRILIVSGSEQTGVVGMALADPLVAQAVDAFENPVEGATIEFMVAEGSGSVAPVQVTTSEDGLASTVWTLGTTAGAQRVVPTMPEAQGFPLEFTALATPDVAAALTVTGGNNQGGVAGASLTEPLEISVEDQYGNAVTGEMVHFAVTQGDGSVDPTDVETDGQGRAATTLTLGTSGDHVVEATVATLEAATFMARSFPAMSLDPLAKTLSTVEVGWTGATAVGFQSYELRRSRTSPVTASDELVTTIADVGARSYSDDTVEIGTRYYYRLYVNYADGYWLATNEETIEAGVSIALEGIGWDMALDATNQRLYVSIPSVNGVAVVSTETFQVVNSFFVGSSPRGIDLSLDGAYLFAALNGAGAVAVVDLSDDSVAEILIGNELGDDRTHDVLNPKPDVLVVTSAPGSNGFAYVVRIDLDFAGGHSATRIANGRIIRASPTLGMGPSGDYVYVGESFSPNSLYKLDMNVAGNPIVLEDDHGSISGATQFDVSPDGTRIYLRSGQVIRTSSFNQAGTIAAGVPLVNLDGTRCFVGTPAEIEVFNTETFLQVAQTPARAAVDKMVLMDAGAALLVLSGDLLYGVPVPQE